MERLDEIRLKAFAARHAGVSNEMFDTLTPQEVARVLEDWTAERRALDRQTDTRLATLLAAIANTVPRKSRRMFTAKDFLPPPPRPKTAAEIDDKITSVMSALARRSNPNGTQSPS